MNDFHVSVLQQTSQTQSGDADFDSLQVEKVLDHQNRQDLEVDQFVAPSGEGSIVQLLGL